MRVIAFMLGTFAVAGMSQAQTVSQVYGDSLTKQTQTVFVRADANFTTYESKAAGSNTTATTTSYAIGGYAGEKRALGVFASSNQQDITFGLNNNRVQNTWRDLHMQARFGWIYPQVVVAMNEMAIDKDGARIADLYGSGIGGGAGIYVPVIEAMVVHADGYVVNSNRARNTTANTVDVGQRLEVDLGASVDVIKNYVDFLIGYKVRRFDVTVDGESFEEQQSAPYAGLQLGAYF